MIIPDRAASVNPFSQTFSKTLRISMIIAKEGHMPFTLSPQQRVYFRRYSGAPLKATLRPRRAWSLAAFGGRECRRLAAETKGDRTPSMVSCPLLTPLTFLCADTSEMCSETGGYGGSVPCVGQISGRCYALNFPCVVRRA